MIQSLVIQVNVRSIGFYVKGWHKANCLNSMFKHNTGTMAQMMFALGQVSHIKKFGRGKTGITESLNNFCNILWEQFVLFHCKHENKKENPHKMLLAIGD